MTPLSITDILKTWAEQTPAATAITAPGRDPLSYGALYQYVASTTAFLAEHGVGRNDRVAVIAPNGPEMATAFLATAAGATSAPLNPSYRAEEIAFYLDDLQAKALVIAAGLDSPARDVARERGIPVYELLASSVAGAAALTGADTQERTARRAHTPSAAPHVAGPDDVALVLHTSGTTSRPKQVPLTHRNVCASARHIGTALALTPNDRCLNVMPLFHIHGLIAAVLSSLAAGGSIVCTPGLAIPDFFDWLGDFRPTWYTAVPTMHHAVLTGAAARGYTPDACTLRFIRSSSSALPRQTLVELEHLFAVPVIEAYGMTEAAHQMTSNPLPPRIRKPGYVGIAAGPEIAIMDEAGTLLPIGETGEVVIRGPNVMQGYVGNAAANASAFTHGWFRTGDQGSLDADGYLVLSGRLKELINRGGEKISPIEVDEVLLDHPVVAQALTFSLPHPTLVEEVAAVVVLREGEAATEQQLREFVSMRLAYYKVPRRIIFADVIPKGATGKPQRIGLAERLGIAGTMRWVSREEHVAPRTPVEEIVAALWAELMGGETPGVHLNFFDDGGDSLLATQLVRRIRDTLGVELSLLQFFDTPTVAEIAAAVGQQLADEVDA